MPAQYAFASARDLFKLTPVDIGRLETSVDFIAEFGDTLAGRGFWPPALGEPQEVASDVVQMARGWSESNITQVNLPTVVQHGDLNPGNILIRDNQDSFPVLIDLSRLGRWPIGYDLSRLSLMLRLRLLDADGHRDWLPDGLRQWSQESVARLDRDSASNHYLCPEGQYCDDQYRLFLKDVGEPYNNTLALSYKLGTMWDLMKVISYQDMSPYKRVWAFIECWKLKGNLETMRVEGD
jgi:hypothetical protein